MVDTTHSMYKRAVAVSARINKEIIYAVNVTTGYMDEGEIDMLTHVLLANRIPTITGIPLLALVDRIEPKHWFFEYGDYTEAFDLFSHLTYKEMIDAVTVLEEAAATLEASNPLTLSDVYTELKLVLGDRESRLDDIAYIKQRIINLLSLPDPLPKPTKPTNLKRLYLANID